MFDAIKLLILIPIRENVYNYASIYYFRTQVTHILLRCRKMIIMQDSNISTFTST